MIVLPYYITWGKDSVAKESYSIATDNLSKLEYVFPIATRVSRDSST